MAILRRSARSKARQTTLQFSPLSSSSPAKQSYSPSVQGRLAAVRYGGAKVNARATAERHAQIQDQDLPGEEFSLPTPEPSSQVLERDRNGGVEDQDEIEVRGEQQAKVAGSDLAEDSEGDDDLVSPAHKRRKMFDGRDMPAPLKSSPPPRRSSRLVSRSSPLPTLEDMATFATPARSSPLAKRATRLRQKQQQRSSPPTRLGRSPSVQTLDSVEIPSPSARGSLHLSDLGSAETSDDDDKILATQAPRRRRSGVAKDPFIVNDDEIQYISDDEVPEAWVPKIRKKNTRDDFVVEDEDVEYVTSDEDEIPPAKRIEKSDKHASARKLKKDSQRRRRQEQDELEDDLQNLQDSDNELSAPKTRTRGGPVTTQRDQAKEHLELLRRRRAGEKVPRVVDSDDEDEEMQDLDLGLIGHPDSDDREGSVHSSTDTDIEDNQVQLQEEDEDDFVVEDTVGRHGRPNSAIPLQFTSFASAKPRELFIHIIEWLVKNKIAPAFSRQDELYDLAFNRIDDQVKAQAGSRLISAAWGTEFKRAILARPNMKVSIMGGTDEENERNCDACNRTKHPARYEFVFSGQPYYKKTLEPLDHSDDEGEESDHNDFDRDEEGHSLPSATHRFYLGRFCAANADMGHKLTHWKYHLNANLLGYLEEQGVLSSDAILAREKLNKKKREKEAENIVDSMQETGMIADLWADFENNLNDARLGMEDFDRKGGRSKGRIGAIRSTVDGVRREWDKDRYRVTRAPSESD
ncbi:hypothetical protein LTR84_005549 [Exophiala bonariae]|uniref:DUF4211 domain-containing protein n=1 Tax=Exophiala bonariae TaxID=1690606 RepID=A0AAV9N7I8_9EURO|nr:hypothetical protein LTR84_005549 [Exophiala bonariae]